jgi:hypothetical protein
MFSREELVGSAIRLSFVTIVWNAIVGAAAFVSALVGVMRSRGSAPAMLGVALHVAVQAMQALSVGPHPEASVLGVTTAVPSLVFLPLLARRGAPRRPRSP